MLVGQSQTRLMPRPGQMERSLACSSHLHLVRVLLPMRAQLPRIPLVTSARLVQPPPRIGMAVIAARPRTSSPTQVQAMPVHAGACLAHPQEAGLASRKARAGQPAAQMCAASSMTPRPPSPGMAGQMPVIVHPS